MNSKNSKRKYSLLAVIFLTFMIPIIYETIIIPIINAAHVQYAGLGILTVVAIVLACIIFGLVSLLVFGLSKLKLKNDKSGASGLVGGVISFAIAALVVPFFEISQVVMFGFTSSRIWAYFLYLLLLSPTALLAASFTKTKWKGALTGLVAYTLMSLVFWLLLFLTHGPG
jgi:hypothetical protein